MTRYAQALSKTPQSEKADVRQVKNSAGGYTFQLDPWQALDRWLILGAEGGSYYASETKLALENARTIQECLKLDGAKTVARIVEVSEAGRAPKNDPAIFALAIAASCDVPTARSLAITAIPRVCRTGTHLFQFAESVNSMRGWGRGLRRGVAAWYRDKDDRKLAYQIAKYGQRGGWSHRDLLRLSHPIPQSEERKAIYKYVTQKDLAWEASESQALQFLSRFETLKAATDPKVAVKLIRDNGFTHEMLPGDLKNDALVWEALLEQMPMTAMIRNLGKMSSVGMLKPLGQGAKKVCENLADADRLRKSRVHPIAVLNALNTYKRGRGVRGSLSWDVNQQIVDALDAAFYLSFGNVQPSGKRTMVALDVSASMTWGEIAGCPGLNPRIASAAMAMVTIRTEPEWYAVGFTSSGYGWGSRTNGLTEVKISPRMRLDDVVHEIERLPMGGTDCALPMLHAAGESLDVDAFQIWTDNETWAGNIHPYQALKAYRDKSGNNATCAVVGCTATDFTIANPSDPGMLDVVGFSTDTPNVLSWFAREMGA